MEGAAALKGFNVSSCPVDHSNKDSRGSDGGGSSSDDDGAGCKGPYEFKWPSTVPAWDDETQMLVLKVGRVDEGET